MAVLNRQCEGIIELIASIYFAESCPASPNASLITTARRRRRTLRDLDMRMARRTERQPRRAGQGPTTISTCEDCKTDYIHLHAQQPDMDIRLVLWGAHSRTRAGAAGTGLQQMACRAARLLAALILTNSYAKRSHSEGMAHWRRTEWSASVDMSFREKRKVLARHCISPSRSPARTWCDGGDSHEKHDLKRPNTSISRYATF